MSKILGISAFYHDSSASIIIDGKIIAAAQEERFTRKKHDSSYPFHAIEFVLNFAKIKLNEVDQIIFFEKPFLKFERLLETYVAFAPRGFKSFCMAMPLWLRNKLFQKRMLFEELKRHDDSFKDNKSSRKEQTAAQKWMKETLDGIGTGLQFGDNKITGEKYMEKLTQQLQSEIKKHLKMECV